ESPKPFIGYSDITALHVAIRQRTGLVTFYGPGLASMGNAKKEWSKERLLKAVTSAEPLGEIPARPEDPYIGSRNPLTPDGPPRRRVPMAAPRDARDAVGDRPRQLHPLLRGRQLPAVARRRDPDAAPERGEARLCRRHRDRRVRGVGSDEGEGSVAP